MCSRSLLSFCVLQLALWFFCASAGSVNFRRSTCFELLCAPACFFELLGAPAGAGGVLPFCLSDTLPTPQNSQFRKKRTPQKTHSAKLPPAKNRSHQRSHPPRSQQSNRSKSEFPIHETPQPGILLHRALQWSLKRSLKRIMKRSLKLPDLLLIYRLLRE